MGQSFSVVEELAGRFVKPILDLCINSEKEHIVEVINHLVKHSNNKTIGKTKLSSNLNCCTECSFVAKSEHGVKIHKGKAHPTNKEEKTQSGRIQQS